MSEETILGKILKGEIPAEFVYEDDDMVVIRDINPVAPIHLLLIPRRAIPTLNEIREADEALIGRMVRVARDMAEREGTAEAGYRLVFNVNADGGQTIFHVHLHLIGGRKLGRMG